MLTAIGLAFAFLLGLVAAPVHEYATEFLNERASRAARARLIAASITRCALEREARRLAESAEIDDILRMIALQNAARQVSLP